MRGSLRNIALLVFSTALGLLSAELGLRLLIPQNLSISYQTRDGLTVHRPGHEGTFRGVETTQPYRINSLGMRDREHQVEKPLGTYRILILGDSFMEALQVPMERSFPRVLEDLFNGAFDGAVEVINAAVSGWGTDDELAYLERYGVRFRPDLILVAMTLTNDVSDNLNEEFHTLVNGELRPRSVDEIPLLDYKFWQFKAFWGSHSHLYQCVRQWWHAKGIEVGGQQLSSHVVQQFRQDADIRLRKGWQLTFELLKTIKTIGTKTGAETAIFLIPISAQLSDAVFSAFLRQHRLSPDDVAPFGPQQRIKQLGAQEGIPIIDLLPCFRECQGGNGRLLVLKKDGHWTEEGHEVAAQIVFRALLSGMLSKLPAQSMPQPKALDGNPSHDLCCSLSF